MLRPFTRSHHHPADGFSILGVSKMQLAQIILLIGSFMLISTAQAADPPPVAQPEQLKSAVWWRQQAVHYAEGITDADAKGRASYDLVYVQGFAGDFEGARASIVPINNPQLKIYAHAFIAKRLKAKGDGDASQSELRQAGEITLLPGNTSHFDVIRRYLDQGQTDDAISLAEKIPHVFHRNSAFQDIAAKLAKQGKLEMAREIVIKHLPPSWEESGWSVMANACADELRIDEARELAAKLTDKKLQDRAYDHLVKALIKADRIEEASQFTERISDEAIRGANLAQITTITAKKQSVEVLQLRIEKSATREEKLALYDLLFDKLADARNVAAAEAAIDSMEKLIKDSPHKAQTSKFGVFDDNGLIAKVRLKYLATAKLLEMQGDREGSQERIARARKAILELPDESGLLKLILVPLFVNAEIQMGDFDGARTTVTQMRKSFARSSAAADLAAALIKSGDVKSGLEVAEMITESLGKDSAIGKSPPRCSAPESSMRQRCYCKRSATIETRLGRSGPSAKP